MSHVFYRLLSGDADLARAFPTTLRLYSTFLNIFSHFLKKFSKVAEFCNRHFVIEGVEQKNRVRQVPGRASLETLPGAPEEK